MAPPSAAHEQRSLYVSIASAAVLGALGVVWGIAVGSQMILLDGVYAVVGIVLSWLLVKASALARQGPTRNFPYGREAATPIVIVDPGIRPRSHARVRRGRGSGGDPPGWQ